MDGPEIPDDDGTLNKRDLEVLFHACVACAAIGCSCAVRFRVRHENGLTFADAFHAEGCRARRLVNAPNN